MNRQEFNTPEKRAECMNLFIHKYQEMLTNLWARWQDEKDYEDIKDYKIAISQKIHIDIKVISLTKNFDLTIEILGFPYKVKVSVRAKTISWKQIK